MLLTNFISWHKKTSKIQCYHTVGRGLFYLILALGLSMLFWFKKNSYLMLQHVQLNTLNAESNFWSRDTTRQLLVSRLEANLNDENYLFNIENFQRLWLTLSQIAMQDWKLNQFYFSHQEMIIQGSVLSFPHFIALFQDALSTLNSCVEYHFSQISSSKFETTFILKLRPKRC